MNNLILPVNIVRDFFHHWRDLQYHKHYKPRTRWLPICTYLFLFVCVIYVINCIYYSFVWFRIGYYCDTTWLCQLQTLCAPSLSSPSSSSGRVIIFSLLTVDEDALGSTSIKIKQHKKNTDAGASRTHTHTQVGRGGETAFYTLRSTPTVEMCAPIVVSSFPHLPREPWVTNCSLLYPKSNCPPGSSGLN